MLTAAEHKENTKSQEELCIHCGLPIPASRRNKQAATEPTAEPSPANFCCAGCDFVYRLLNKHNLTQYYSLREKSSEASPAAVTPSSSTFAFFDQEDFRAAHITQIGERASCFDLTLAGVHCAACVWLIERTPKLLPGLSLARLDFGKNRVRVTYDPEQVKPSRIANLFDSLGYTPSPFSGEDSAGLQSYERHFLLRLGVSGFCAGNTMMIAVSLYQGMFTGIPEDIRSFLHWACLVLTLPVVTYAAWPFYRLGFGGLRFRSFHIDLPISLGIIVAFIASCVNTLRGAEHVYFDSICMLVFLLLGGRWLQHRRLRKIARDLDLLPELLPASAHRWDGKEWQEVLRQSLKVGDQIEARPDEIIPADGRVLTGNSTVNRALITGESRPIAVLPGDQVIAGTKNLSQPLTIEVEHTEQQTRIGRIVALVEEASKKRAHINALTDRLSGYFVAIVLLLAVLTFAAWYQSGFFTALDNTLALLVITCPCALGLAAPIAFSLALSQAAKRGILVRSAEALERVTQVRQVFFDKTGTLTEGNCKVAVSYLFGIGLQDLAPALLSLEKNVEHPVAHALRDFAIQHSNPMKSAFAPEFETISAIPGKGVSAQDSHKRVWRLGAVRFVNHEIGELPAEIANKIADISSKAFSPVVLSRDREVLAIFGIGDEVRLNAAKLIGSLRERDLEIRLISGDAGSSTRAVGHLLGLAPEHVYGELSPEQKMELVKSAQLKSPCMMIGDGVNDAGALAAASVGIGISGGAESSLRVADIFITKTDPDLLRLVFIGSKRVMRLIRVNLGISLLYNVLGAAGAMFGVVDPLLAAILMPLSSLTVIITASSFKSFD